jgi:hypothetical protein
MPQRAPLCVHSENAPQWIRQGLKLKALVALRQGPPTPITPVKAPAATPPSRWKKIAPGQLDLALFHVLELQTNAHVKGDRDAHRDVRVLPFLSSTQSSSQAPSSTRP